MNIFIYFFKLDSFFVFKRFQIAENDDSLNQIFVFIFLTQYDAYFFSFQIVFNSDALDKQKYSEIAIFMQTFYFVFFENFMFSAQFLINVQKIEYFFFNEKKVFWISKKNVFNNSINFLFVKSRDTKIFFISVVATFLISSSKSKGFANSRCMSKNSDFFSATKTKNWNFSSNLFVSKTTKFMIDEKFEQTDVRSNKLSLSFEFSFKFVKKISIANFLIQLKTKNINVKTKNNDFK